MPMKFDPATYKPQARSVAGLTIEFLRQNPDEYLLPDDVAVKFSKPRDTVRALLRPAVHAGLLRHVAVPGIEDRVYQIGVRP